MIDVLKNTGRFIFLIFLQVVIINNIELNYFVSPILIVFFVLALPMNTPNWLLLIASFLMGLTLDAFMNTPGIASFSLVTTASLRPILLRILQPRDGYQIDDMPNVQKLGWAWFMRYAVALVLVFHLLYFTILGISQDNVFVIIGRTLTSSFFTMILLSLFQLFNLKNAR